MTNATTTDNSQTTSGLVITPNAADTAFVTNFQITNITGGTLFLNNGTTQVTNGEFITVAQGAAGLKFTPTANSTASGGFTVQESTSATTAGLGGPTATATIAVNLVLHQPNVTNTTTEENTQTTSGLVVTPNSQDAAFVNDFQVTSISDGTLYLNNGTTQVTNDEFITVAEGSSGLKFTPTANSTASGSFTVQESTSATTAGLGGPTATATVTVNPSTSVHLGLLLLDPSGSGALDDTGSGSITVTNGGAVVIDSDNSTAAILSGAGGVNASTIDVTGGTKVTGSGKFSSTVVHAAPIADPLGLSLPTAPSTTFAAVNYSGRTTLTLSPGTYVGGIKISGSGSVILLPGVYYMEGGGFSITGSGSVTGAGVLLINAPSKSTDSISLMGSGNMTLSPSSILSGAYAPYDGITILQDPTSAAPINIAGAGTLSMTGVLYAPKATIDITGAGGLLVNPDAVFGRAEVIASHLKNTGSGRVTINVDSPTVTVGTPITTSVPGEPVPLVLRVSDASSVAQAATFTFNISFGDGDSTSLASKAPLIVNHVYTKTGTFTVQVTATDEYGYTSAPATETIKVVPVAVETDPFNSKLTALFVGGTSGNDTVKFAASGKSGIAVTLNGVSEGTYSASGPLIVFGQGGSDTVSESGLSNPDYLIESLSTDNVETDLDDEALKWAGLAAAVEILNA